MSLPQTVHVSISNFWYKLTQPTVYLVLEPKTQIPIWLYNCTSISGFGTQNQIPILLHLLQPDIPLHLLQPDIYRCICSNQTYTVASAPTMTGLVFGQRFRLFLAQSSQTTSIGSDEETWQTNNRLVWRKSQHKIKELLYKRNSNVWICAALSVNLIKCGCS